ncbi:MAG: N,N'-diacetyllegionaminate synthase [Cyclobacteriaceae bacterium]|jgi:N-acetylneuraminate synthase
MKNDEVFLIAEIGQAHDGSLGILHSYIDALKDTGIHAIKFQTHIAAAESSPEEPFRINFSYEDESRQGYWRRMEFSLQEWSEIKKHCENVGLEFLSSPFSIAAVDLLESIGIGKYKIGSGEITNNLLLDRVGQTKKPVILSSGMSSFYEIQDAVNFLIPFGNEVSILQCTTSYPTPSQRVGLNVISELKKKFEGHTIGYSDHSGNIYAGLAAVASGARILEFHAVFDKRMFGPDSSSSLNIEQISQLAEGVKFINEAILNPIDKNDVSEYIDSKRIFQKSLSVNKELAAGHIIRKEDLESKKPANTGINARDFSKVVGKKLKLNLAQYSFLKYEHIEWK